MQGGGEANQLHNLAQWQRVAWGIYAPVAAGVRFGPAKYRHKASKNFFRAPRVYRRQINAGAPGDLKSARWGRWAAPIGRERQRGLMGLICEP